MPQDASEVPKPHPYLGERRVANKDRRMSAEERKPAAWKAEGHEERPSRGREKPGKMPGFLSNVVGESLGAGNETRTRDPLLGKQMLYQLSYSRPTTILMTPAAPCQRKTARRRLRRTVSVST